MKPTHQTIFKVPEGNCVQACVASILELPLDEVPNFILEDDWFAALREFVATFGMAVVDLYFEGRHWTTRGRHPVVDRWGDIYWMAGGDGPRGIKHCVVYCGSEMVHDPLPGGGG